LGAFTGICTQARCHERRPDANSAPIAVRFARRVRVGFLRFGTVVEPFAPGILRRLFVAFGRRLFGSGHWVSVPGLDVRETGSERGEQVVPHAYARP